jgi:hypothetical protein
MKSGDMEDKTGLQDCDLHKPRPYWVSNMNAFCTELYLHAVSTTEYFNFAT